MLDSPSPFDRGTRAKNPFGLADVGSMASPALADIDADGDLDAFVGARGNSSFFANTGTATRAGLRRPRDESLRPRRLGPPCDPDLADIDADGDLDALVGERRSANALLPEHGHGERPRIRAPSTNPNGLAGVGSIASPIFADLDGDGDLDALIGNRDGNTLFFANTGTATAPAFAAPATNPFGLADVGRYDALPAALADIDGDGDLDAVVGEGRGGSSSSRRSSSTPEPARTASTTTATAASISAPTPAARMPSTPASSPASSATTASTTTPTARSTGAATAGRPALLGPARRPRAAAADRAGLRHRAGAAAARAAARGAAEASGRGLTPGSPGEDTRAHMPPESAHRLLREASLELARLRRVRGAYRTTWRRIARAQARLAFAAALLAAAPVAEPAAAVDPVYRHGLIDLGVPVFVDSGLAFVDIDGDGDFDLFTTGYQGIRFFENTGTAAAPALAAAQTNPFGLVSQGALSVPRFADLDADGDFDLMIPRTVTQTAYFQNTGTAAAPAFAAPVTNPFGLASVVHQLADLDGDGDLDGFRFSSTATSFLQNTGSASAPAFAAPVTNPFGLPAFANHLADLDGDGDLDALLTPTLLGDAQRIENTGTATAPAFAAPDPTPLGLEIVGDFDLVDLDGDGDLDAFSAGRYGGELPVSLLFENTGGASTPRFTKRGNPFGFGDFDFYAQIGYAYESQGASSGLGDIDGDGDLDAFVEASVFGKTFLQNTGTASAPAFAPVPARDARPERQRPDARRPRRGRRCRCTHRRRLGRHVLLREHHRRERAELRGARRERLRPRGRGRLRFTCARRPRR